MFIDWLFTYILSILLGLGDTNKNEYGFKFWGYYILGGRESYK